jgi:hypothetical protein
VTDPVIKKQAQASLTALRGMHKWQPERRGNMYEDGSDWSFGAPIAAFKCGILDAVACIQVSTTKLIEYKVL